MRQKHFFKNLLAGEGGGGTASPTAGCVTVPMGTAIETRRPAGTPPLLPPHHLPAAGVMLGAAPGCPGLQAFATGCRRWLRAAACAGRRLGAGDSGDPHGAGGGRSGTPPPQREQPWPWPGMLRSLQLPHSSDAAKHAAEPNRAQATGVRLPSPCGFSSPRGSPNPPCAPSSSAAGSGPAPTSLPAAFGSRGSPRGPRLQGVHGCIPGKALSLPFPSVTAGPRHRVRSRARTHGQEQEEQRAQAMPERLTKAGHTEKPTAAPGKPFSAAAEPLPHPQPHGGVANAPTALVRGGKAPWPLSACTGVLLLQTHLQGLAPPRRVPN